MGDLINRGPNEHYGRVRETAANGHRHGGQIGKRRHAERPALPLAERSTARTRILAAATEIVAQGGYARATVQAIVARAGVPRETFYRLFSNRQECFLGAFDRAVECCAEQIDAAGYAEDCWNDRLRRTLTLLLQFAERHPDMARLLLVESMAGGPLVVGRREELLRHLAAAIEMGDRRISVERLDAATTAAGRRSPWPEMESLLAAAAALVWSRLHGGERPLTALVNPLMAMLVLPHRGLAGAVREISAVSGPVPQHLAH